MKFSEDYIVTKDYIRTRGRGYFGNTCYNIIGKVVTVEVFSNGNSIAGSEWPQESPEKAQEVGRQLEAEGIQHDPSLILELFNENGDLIGKQ